MATTNADDGKERILLVTLSNIGDAVMTTPVLQNLHLLYPESLIDMVVDKRSRELFEHCPYRGDLIEKNKKDFLRGMPGLVFSARKKKYRLIVDLRTDFMSFLLRSGKRLGKRNGDPGARHSVEQHLSVIQSILDDRIIERCCIWTGTPDREYARNILGKYDRGPFLCIAPGANAEKKIWDWHKFQQLINQTGKHFRCVLLLGGMKDRPIAERIKKMNTVATVLDLCGETTLLQAAAVLSHASLFIGNDSGLGHIAAAVGVPTCTLFGPGEPDRYRPWGNGASWLVGENSNINNISVEQVMNTLVEHQQLPAQI